MTEKTLGCYHECVEADLNGWAKTKYIPDLYSTGYIHDKLEIFIGNYSVVKRRYNGISKNAVYFDS